ncbi:MAG: fibrobacter succinogenes major paralogous domain-containing protein [Bacteroidia bacterium]|nr:fibrobacter succinogenes major paralogous domain-containing protein [Bacteroidia bacterium]
MKTINNKLFTLTLFFLCLTGLQAQTVKDIDGNLYNTVTIGTQVWMAGNLKVTKYTDGAAIPLVTDNTTWSNLSTPGYCWYENDEATYKNIYGALYNWHVVSTGKLCPIGWHVSTDAEWTTLTDLLGGKYVAGGKLKGTGKKYWNNPNTGATNSEGFTALPGGYRDYYIMFSNIGNYGNWWSSTQSNDDYAYFRCMDKDNSSLVRNYKPKKDGFSVRCIKD